MSRVGDLRDSWKLRVHQLRKREKDWRHERNYGEKEKIKEHGNVNV